MDESLYKPHLMHVTAIRDEAPGIRTLELAFQDPAVASSFSFQAGQFAEYSVFGVGECTFCIASAPTEKGVIRCTFQVVGKVTQALYQLEIGSTMGFRGPLGNSFPISEMKGKNLLFIGMGIGLAPVRSVIKQCLDTRADFNEVTIITGARRADLFIYKDEIREWSQRKDILFVKTVDPGGNPADWDGKVGLVPTVVKEANPPAKEAYAVLCGPPIGIKFTLPVLAELGFPPERVYTTLENRMKCGIGKCGRCNIGSTYVCKDGPVFSVQQLNKLPQEF